MTEFEKDLQSFDTAQDKIINRVRRMFSIAGIGAAVTDLFKK